MMSYATWVVITGDVVRSQDLKDGAYQQSLATLHTILSELTNGDEKRFALFRGDSFQLMSPNVTQALYTATCIRLALKAGATSVDLRQSIAIAPIKDPSADVKTATGEAFIRSGRNLDALKNERFVFDSMHEDWNLGLEVTLKWFDLHLSGLTQTQAQVLLAYLQSPDLKHKELADKMGKSRVNITQILNAAQHKLVMQTLKYFEFVISN